MAAANQDAPKSAIYTRTGDEGKTSLFNGDRMFKNEDFFEALGTVDEVSSWIGVALHTQEMTSMIATRLDPEFVQLMKLERLYDISKTPSGLVAERFSDLRSFLRAIQCTLLDIGSHIATPLSRSKESKIERTRFGGAPIVALEKMIDHLDATLPKLTNFILPTGPFHMCRVVARRAERLIVPIVKRGDCDSAILRYMNRLSDFFFVLARFCSREEIVYKKVPEPESPSTSTRAE
jgi:cob(I)alamin adenosyltransferase